MAEVNESIVPQRTDEPYWYVVHTYSGYEKKVMDNIKRTRDNRGLKDQILDVRVPTKRVTEIKDGKESKPKEKKLFPGYVLIKMIMNETTWYIVRNTRGVTGFVGPGSKAVPLEDYSEEDENTDNGDLFSEDGAGAMEVLVDIKEGDNVMIHSGPFAGNSGIVQSINPMKKTLTVNIVFFDRDTSVDMDILNVKKI